MPSLSCKHAAKLLLEGLCIHSLATSSDAREVLMAADKEHIWQVASGPQVVE